MLAEIRTVPADLSPKRLWLVLHKIRCFQPAPCAMANMKHFNPLLLLQHTVDHTIDVELVPVEKMAEPSILGRQRAAVGHFFKAENSLFEPRIPFRSRARAFGVDLFIEAGKVTLGASSDLDQIGPGWLRTQRKTAAPAGLFLFGRPPDLAESLRRHRCARQYPVAHRLRVGWPQHRPHPECLLLQENCRNWSRCGQTPTYVGCSCEFLLLIQIE